MDGSFRYVVVGAGFFGAVMARRIAEELDEPVLILERRSHIGGNSHSETDPRTGIEVHRYGTHLFHTSNQAVWTFVKRFSDFNNYRHRVFTRHRGRVYTMPINLQTINAFFGVDLSPAEARTFIADQIAQAAVAEPANLEEKAISLIGRPLYEAFIRGYTAKQWETDPTNLPPDIITRLPVRFSRNDFYFADLYEGLPIDGYATLFDRLLAHPRITVRLGCDFFAARSTLPAGATVIYTGPIDRYFDYRCGRLGWRTLDFETESLDVDDHQGASVMNYADAEIPYTRIHEFKHLHPERCHDGRTTIMREYSRFAAGNDEPYYPINTAADRKTYDAYRAMAAAQDTVIFGGRLGSYRYLDMHQAIAAAFKAFERLAERHRAG